MLPRSGWSAASIPQPGSILVTLRDARYGHSPLTGALRAVLYCGIHKDFIKHVLFILAASLQNIIGQESGWRRSNRERFVSFILIRWNHAEEPWVSESSS